MKVACIAASRIPSTTANSIQLVKACFALKRNGHEVHLWVPGTEALQQDQLAALYGLGDPMAAGGLKIIWLPCSRALRHYDLAWRALAAARSWDSQVVYTWLPQAALLAAWRGFPVILEVHDRPTGRIAPSVFRRFLRTPGKKRLLVITRALAGKLATQYGKDMQQIDLQVAPNGTEPERYTDREDPHKARRDLELPDLPTVGFNGHFYSGRGMGLLQELAYRFPQIHFLWIGGRPQDVTYWQERLQAGGISNVTLTGFVPNQDLPAYLAACDILLMPYERRIAGSSGGNSADICSPMKMFDYLSAGRAIISSDLPVVHEVLHEGNAIFCPPEDADAWTAALRDLLDDPVRRLRISACARQDAERYTWVLRAKQALEGLAP